MFSILDIYIARTLLSTTALSLSVLAGLSMLIRFIDEMKQVGRGSYDMSVATVYILLSFPREIEQFFPMATLIGGLIGMGILASNSELVIMQCAGLSRFNIINSAMKSALVMVLFVMALGEWVSPVTEAMAKEIRTQAISGGSLFSSDSLVWAKDEDNFVSIGEVINKDKLRKVSIYEFDQDLKLTLITTADIANFSDDSWQLNQVSYTKLTEGNISIDKVDNAIWRSSLTPDKLGVVTITPEALSIRGLNEYITYLQNNGQDPDRYKLALWRKMLQPLTVAVMLLTALSFIFGPLRSVTMGARVILGVLTGFGFFIANEVFGPLSLIYQLPPFLGALLPSVLFTGIAGYLLRR